MRVRRECVRASVAGTGGGSEEVMSIFEGLEEGAQAPLVSGSSTMLASSN